MIFMGRTLFCRIGLILMYRVWKAAAALEVTNSSVKCDPEQMHVFFEFRSPFYGTIYAEGYHNEKHCRVYGEGSKKLAISLHLNNRKHQDPYCGMILDDETQEFRIGLLASEQRDILVDGVREFQVHCSYELNDVTLKLPAIRGIQIGEAHDAPQRQKTIIKGAGQGIAPVVEMAVREGWGIEGKRVQVAAIGQPITLDVYLSDNVPYDFIIFNCIAHDGTRTPSGTITLVDDRGCAQIIERVQEGTVQSTLDHRAVKHTHLHMRGFQFSTTDVVNFECQIRPCLNRCNVTQCSDHKLQKRNGGHVRRSVSRRDAYSLNDVNNDDDLELETSIVMLPEESHEYPTAPHNNNIQQNQMIPFPKLDLQTNEIMEQLARHQQRQTVPDYNQPKQYTKPAPRIQHRPPAPTVQKQPKDQTRNIDKRLLDSRVDERDFHRPFKQASKSLHRFTSRQNDDLDNDGSGPLMGSSSIATVAITISGLVIAVLLIVCAASAFSLYTRGPSQFYSNSLSRMSLSSRSSNSA